MTGKEGRTFETSDEVFDAYLPEDIRKALRDNDDVEAEEQVEELIKKFREQLRGPQGLVGPNND